MTSPSIKAAFMKAEKCIVRSEGLPFTGSLQYILNDARVYRGNIGRKNAAIFISSCTLKSQLLSYYMYETEKNSTI